MMLHHLARNPVVQEAIYVDLKGYELEPGKFLPLLRACLDCNKLPLVSKGEVAIPFFSISNFNCYFKNCFKKNNSL